MADINPGYYLEDFDSLTAGMPAEFLILMVPLMVFLLHGFPQQREYLYTLDRAGTAISTNDSTVSLVC